MTIQEINKITAKFLDTLEEKKIYKFNSKFFHEQTSKIENHKKRNTIIANALEKVIKLIQNSNLTGEEKTVFINQNGIWFFSSNLELIKTFLMMIVDEQKIIFNEHTTYGRFLRSICDKIGYDDKLRNELFDTFYVDFRNAVFHNNYDVTIDGISYEKQGHMIHLTTDELTGYIYNAKAIFDIMGIFLDTKSNELNKKAEELEKQADDLEKI